MRGRRQCGYTRTMIDPPPTCWVVTDGSVGMEVQCVGLARLMGLDPVVKRVAVRAPWRWLPPGLWPAPFASLGQAGDALGPPWPQVLISVGRRSIALSMAVRRAAKGATFTVQLQNPKVALTNFDVVVVPRHDGVAGPNVIETMGALHGITPEVLAQAAERFRVRLAPLPRPLVAVLVGGTSRSYRVGPEEARVLAAGLRHVAAATGAGFAVTPSRRTPPETVAALSDALAGLPCAIWDGTGENPYHGYLALCDAVVVTCDSVNMVTEFLRHRETGARVHDGGRQRPLPPLPRIVPRRRLHATVRRPAGRLVVRAAVRNRARRRGNPPPVGLGARRSHAGGARQLIF